MEKIRVWAKVQRIERLNPLFPSEAGHELAETGTSPFDTVLSLSREMVTAVCQVLGSEPLGGEAGGKLRHLRYPAQPASSAYRPSTDDIARIVLGDLKSTAHRALNVASLANRPEIDVCVDGHSIVTRHLAVLAMTGAGKSWTVRRIIEQLADKNYPIVIFDPHGDYTGLADVGALKARVRRYYAQYRVFDEPADHVRRVIESLSSYELAKTQAQHFDDIFGAARAFVRASDSELTQRANWLSDYIQNPKIIQFGIKPDLYFLGDFVEALVRAGKNNDQQCFQQIEQWADVRFAFNPQEAGWLAGLLTRIRPAAKALRLMEGISKKVSGAAAPLPVDRTELVKHGGISIIVLAGYTSDFQATLYSMIAGELFQARVDGSLPLPVLLVLEEAHNFAGAHANTTAEARAVMMSKQIAQEGRKFGVGLVLISQRPSRLDETTLSQCNSYVIMRMVNPADQSFVRKVIETIAEDEVKLLPDLDVGEALLSGQFINFPVLVRMKAPSSKGEREEIDAFVQLEQIVEQLKRDNKNQQ
ncbi:MAG: ATP-binding protein [Deltaproteobacteria bacterium]|nr:ATP-binding protein [Deltaproteobacteria bacterium]